MNHLYEADTTQTEDEKQQGPIEQLMARLNKQAEIDLQKKVHMESSSDEEHTSSPTDPYAGTPPTESLANSDGRPDAAEVFRLNKELELTRERMAQLEVELTQSRITKHTVEQAIDSPFPAPHPRPYNQNKPANMPPYVGLNWRGSPFPTLR